jgi:hypothetical protein
LFKGLGRAAGRKRNVQKKERRNSTKWTS